jgi:nucleotide-binding universal stress UspA family protein
MQSEFAWQFQVSCLASCPGFICFGLNENTRIFIRDEGRHHQTMRGSTDRINTYAASKNRVCITPGSPDSPRRLNNDTEINRHEINSVGAAMFHRILIAVNDSAAAIAAAEVASDLAQQLDARLAILHVIDPSAAMGPEVGINQDLLKSMRTLATSLLRRVRARMATKQKVEQIILEDEPAQGILQTAENWQADLLVIGADARGRIATLLLGSVADTVLRHSRCPVITVRERITAAIAEQPGERFATHT